MKTNERQDNWTSYYRSLKVMQLVVDSLWRSCSTILMLFCYFVRNTSLLSSWLVRTNSISYKNEQDDRVLYVCAFDSSFFLLARIVLEALSFLLIRLYRLMWSNLNSDWKWKGNLKGKWCQQIKKRNKMIGKNEERRRNRDRSLGWRGEMFLAPKPCIQFLCFK